MTSSLSRATMLSLAAFAAAAAFDHAFGTTMSWLLPPESFGVLGVASTWFLLLSFFVASGFPTALAKFLAEDDRPRPGLVRYALRANLLVCLVVVALFLGLTFYGPLSPGPGYGRLVWVIGAALVLLSVGGTLQFALQGRMAFASFALLHASKSLNKLLFGVALVALGFGVTGALAGLAVGGLALLIFSWAALRAHAPDALAPGELSSEEKRRFLRFTLTVFAGSFALTLLMSLDLLGLKYLAPREGPIFSLRAIRSPRSSRRRRSGAFWRASASSSRFSAAPPARTRAPQLRFFVRCCVGWRSSSRLSSPSWSSIRACCFTSCSRVPMPTSLPCSW